jgi:PAS domain-containing protein
VEDTEFRTVLEHISDGVLFIDHDGVIRLYNGALVRMFSIDRDLHGIQIFSLRRDYPLRQGIFRVDKAFREASRFLHRQVRIRLGKENRPHLERVAEVTK